MKTIGQVKKDIEVLVKWINEHSTTNTEANNKRDLARLKFLRDCQLYLSTEPSEEFLLKEASRLKAENPIFLDKRRLEQLNVLEYCLHE
jgi:hypothetical protein